MKTQIKHRFTEAVLHEGDYVSILEAVSGAIKAGADLSGADLSDANLSGANLTKIKEDLYSILSTSNEVAYLLNALKTGAVDGSTYEGACCCLVGTIANSKGCKYDAIPGLVPDSTRAAERWFLGIRKGDTPANNQVSKITTEWVEGFIASKAVTA